MSYGVCNYPLLNVRKLLNGRSNGVVFLVYERYIFEKNNLKMVNYKMYHNSFIHH